MIGLCGFPVGTRCECGGRILILASTGYPEGARWETPGGVLTQAELEVLVKALGATFAVYVRPTGPSLEEVQRRLNEGVKA